MDTNKQVNHPKIPALLHLRQCQHLQTRISQDVTVTPSWGSPNSVFTILYSQGLGDVSYLVELRVLCCNMVVTDDLTHTYDGLESRSVNLGLGNTESVGARMAVASPGPFGP